MRQLRREWHDYPLTSLTNGLSHFPGVYNIVTNDHPNVSYYDYGMVINIVL